MLLKKASRQQQQGVALPLVMMVSAVVLLMAVGMLRLSVSDLTFTTANRSRTRAFYAAEMGLARALDKLRTDYYGGVSNLQPSITYSGTAVDDTGNTPAQKALPDETFNTANNYYEAALNTADGNFRVRYRLQEAPWLLASPDATRVYTVEAVARDLVKGTWAGLRTTFTAQRTMLWYYGVFFADDIEFGNAATLSFVGPVHTNKNLMLSSASTTNLTFDSFLTSAGRIYRGDPFFSSNMGTVRIKNSAGNYVNMTTGNDGIKELAGFQTRDLGNPAKGDGLPNPADTWKEDPNWKQGALDTWNGKVRDKAHGVEVEAPPPVQSIDRGGYYEGRAGLKIITNNAGVTQITKQDGTVINPTSLGANNPISTSTFWNGREKKSVTVTNIDVQKLTNAGLYPTNGLIYASRDDARADANPLDNVADNSRRPNGIRLTNAAELPGPITMVTNNPLYIKGDFNLHRDANGRKPGQNGYNAATDTWKPAATMADATTILSNGFSDASNASSNNKSASANTEVNTVLISGYHNSNTTEGWSGGMHNFPRLLENWSGRTLTMRGSMIELWQSKFATGPWSTDGGTGFNYYTPPTRDWGIDSAFSATAMPPAFADLFPSTTRSIMQRKWQQLQPDEALLSV